MEPTLTPRWVNSLQEGKQLAQEWGMLFFETSAKTGANVRGLFDALGQQLLARTPASVGTLIPPPPSPRPFVPAVKAIPAPAHMGPVICLDDFDREQRALSPASCNC